MQKSKYFIVIGHHIIFAQESPWETPKPVVFGIYEAESATNAYEKFLQEYTKGDVKKAQVFYNEVIVVETAASEGAKFYMSDTFGELAKFPNFDLYKHGFDRS
jgi:hypothetical protein